MIGVENFSKANIMLQRTFSNSNSINNVHCSTTFNLPVDRSIFAEVVAIVQIADIVIRNNEEKKLKEHYVN